VEKEMKNQALTSHKRSRAIRVLLFPAGLIFLLIGRSLLWIDYRRQLAKSRKSNYHEEAVKFTVLKQKHTK
jgi:hypothetical protein